MAPEDTELESVYAPNGIDGSIDCIEEVVEYMDWRMGLLAGYCPSTNRPHRPDELERKTGVLDALYTESFRCSECGLTLDKESYIRLTELYKIRGGMCGTRGVKITFG